MTPDALDTRLVGSMAVAPDAADAPAGRQAVLDRGVERCRPKWEGNLPSSVQTVRPGTQAGPAADKFGGAHAGLSVGVFTPAQEAAKRSPRCTDS